MAGNPPIPNEALAAGGNGVRTALAFHERDLAALTDRLERIEHQLTEIASAIAAHTALCVTPGQVQALEDRLSTRLRAVEAWQLRASGGGQFLWLAVTLLVAMGAVLATLGKGKWW